MNEDSDVQIGEEHDRGNPLAAEIESPNHYREAALLANRFYDRGIAYVQGHRENLPLTWDCWLLAMEKYDLLGVDDQVKLAARHNVTKQDVSKIVKQIHRRIGATLLSRRNLAGCKKMSQKRKEQLSK